MEFFLIQSEDFLLEGYTITLLVFIVTWIFFKNYRSEIKKMLVALNVFLACVTLPGLIIGMLNFKTYLPYLPRILELLILSIITNALPIGFLWIKMRRSFIYSSITAIRLNFLVFYLCLEENA
ncbi:MAG: hypothetical protein H7Y04_13940 [Verrucomicrobia bacterium]|nr:hypothetical protein [Cytophagales bacterium]